MNTCDYCGQPLYYSGCPAAGCDGWGCPDCEVGCDLDWLDVEEGGSCAPAVALDEQERAYDSKF